MFSGSRLCSRGKDVREKASTNRNYHVTKTALLALGETVYSVTPSSQKRAQKICILLKKRLNSSIKEMQMNIAKQVSSKAKYTPTSGPAIPRRESTQRSLWQCHMSLVCNSSTLGGEINGARPSRGILYSSEQAASWSRSPGKGSPGP